MTDKMRRNLLGRGYKLVDRLEDEPAMTDRPEDRRGLSPEALRREGAAPLIRAIQSDWRFQELPDTRPDEATLARIRAALASQADDPSGPCWFCKGTFPVDALIAGYDTFDEQRFACLACNERMSGNWATGWT